MPLKVELKEPRGLNGEFKRQLLEDLFAEPVDDHGVGLFNGDAARVAVEELVLADAGGEGLMLQVGRLVLDLNVWGGVRAALVADEQGVALGEVPPRRLRRG